jgi:hypothetical protein
MGGEISGRRVKSARVADKINIEINSKGPFNVVLINPSRYEGRLGLEMEDNANGVVWRDAISPQDVLDPCNRRVPWGTRINFTPPPPSSLLPLPKRNANISLVMA